MRRVVIALALALGMVIGLGVPVSGLGLVSVTLTCTDGTNVTYTVDTATLSSLTDSVNAMILYPAGLTCTLVQNPLPLGAFFGQVAVAGTNDTFIVGGGRWQVPCSAIFPATPPPPPPPTPPPPPPAFVGTGVIARVPGSWSYPSGTGDQPVSVPAQATDVLIFVNIAVNFHLANQADPASAFGTLNETIPANQSPCDTTQVGESHFTSKPTCLFLDLNVTPPVAYGTSHVTQASDGSGQVPFPAPVDQTVGTVPVKVGDFIHFGFQDNGNPPGQNPTATAPTTDMLNGVPASPEGTQTACDTTVKQWDPTVLYHLGFFDGSKQFGNLTLHH